MAQPPPPAGQEPVPDPCNLIVNYIPTPVTDAELHGMFSEYGELVSARVIVDRASGHPKGYGFVKFKNVADANRAMMNMTGFTIYGKRLKVTPARGFQCASIDSFIARTQYGPPATMVNVPPPTVMYQPMMIPAPVVYTAEEFYATGPSFELQGSQCASPPLSMVEQSTTSAIPAPPPSF